MAKPAFLDTFWAVATFENTQLRGLYTFAQLLNLKMAQVGVLESSLR
jgi:hypothetical protein